MNLPTGRISDKDKNNWLIHVHIRANQEKERAELQISRQQRYKKQLISGILKDIPKWRGREEELNRKAIGTLERIFDNA